MQHDSKLVEAMALDFAVAICPSTPELIAPAYVGTVNVCLTSLCTHLRIPPAALAALADGRAVVVPAEELDQLIKRDHGCERAACADQRGEFCVCGRRLTKIAASPYAMEARDD